MATVRKIAEDIVRREGGYVNDPDDPGGPTKFGVTLRTLKGLGFDLDRDGSVTLNDVKLLTKNQATDIFLKNYFHDPGIGQLPEVIQASVFDMYVNAGNNAVKILQRLLAQLGFPTKVDGVIGAATIQAANNAFHAAPHHLADAYGIARRNYYYALADRRAKSRKYARRRDGGKGGWITRAEEFLDKRYHLTAAQHKERTAKWD